MSLSLKIVRVAYNYSNFTKTKVSVWGWLTNAEMPLSCHSDRKLHKNPTNNRVLFPIIICSSWSNKLKKLKYVIPMSSFAGTSNSIEAATWNTPLQPFTASSKLPSSCRLALNTLKRSPPLHNGIRCNAFAKIF